jgi:hypothetical protein
MKIETRFDIGDEIILMRRNEIRSETINEIFIIVDQHGICKELYSYISEKDDFIKQTVDSDLCFKTELELIDRLRKDYLRNN